MGLETLIQTVLEDGRKEASQIVEAARAERDHQLAEIRQQGAKRREQREAAAREEGERQRVQSLARAELEAKKIGLLAQKEVLDEVKRRTLEALGRLEENESILRRLIEVNEAEVNRGRIFSSAKDASVLKKMAPKQFGGTIDCIGGIIIEIEEGSQRLDLRYESLMEDLWEKTVKAAAETLWSEGGR